MRLALVTTSDTAASAVGAHAAALTPELAARCELSVFVEPNSPARTFAGESARSVLELHPRDFEQVLFTVGDEARLAFVVPLVRAFGGAVLLHDWALSELACAAHPALRAGGWRALAAALREGGLAAARELRAGRTAPLNRSIVRWGDAFLVHSAQLGTAIRDDRNAPTPIGVAEGFGEGATNALELGAGRWGELSERYLALMQRFPLPRAARKPLVALRFAQAMAARRAN